MSTNRMEKLKRLSFFHVLKPLRHPIQAQRRKRAMSAAFADNKTELKKSISMGTLCAFQQAFSRFVCEQPQDVDIVKEFCKADLYALNLCFSPSECPEGKPIVLCVVKDDRLRMEMFIKHYRAIGITRFVVLDNQSSDGTREYLLAQNDVNTYCCSTSYTTRNREAWINRLLAIYGFDRWYLCADSDELFTYLEMERHSISDLVQALQKRNIYRCRALLLEMYPQHGAFIPVNADDLESQYCFFDVDSYFHASDARMEKMQGGPRYRLFSTPDQPFLSTQTKYPLFYFQQGDIHGNSHFLFPYKRNYGSPCYSILRHYKFIAGDWARYQARASNGNFASSSAEYNIYVSKLCHENNFSFYGSGSALYQGTGSLAALRFVENPFA